MEKKIDLLKRLITEGEKFTFENFSHLSVKEHGTYGGSDTPAWVIWKQRSYNIVHRLMGDGSPSLNLVESGFKVVTKGNHDDKFQEAKENIIAGLKMTIDVLELDSFGEAREIPESVDNPKPSSPPDFKKVFVVHGHDHLLKTDVERFIHQVGLDPVVLHRRPDKGQTLIEKFESLSE